MSVGSEVTQQCAIHRSHSVAAVTMIVALMATLLLSTHDVDFLPHDHEWGENMLAHGAAVQFRDVGFKYGLIENLGTNDSPRLYTHNVNIGNLTYVLLDSVGVTTVRGKQVGATVVFGISLFCIYAAAARFSTSGLCGLVVLSVFCLDYANVTTYFCNALRAWHWVGLFGMLWATHFVVVSKESPWRRLPAMAIASSAAFGCGYDFFGICALASLFAAFALDQSPLFSRKRANVLSVVFIGIATPFVIRQIQIVSILGVSYWLHDIYYSVGIKIPYAGWLLGLPPLEEIDAYYNANKILRPPASPTADVYSSLQMAGRFILYLSIPTYGWLAFILLPFAWATALCYLYLKWPCRKSDGRAGIGILVLAILVSAAIGLVVLSPFSFHVYLKHRFPLMAAILLIPKGVLLFWLLKGVMDSASCRRRLALVACSIGALIVAIDSVAVEVNNRKNDLWCDLAWRKFSKKHRNDVVLTSCWYLTHNPDEEENRAYVDGRLVAAGDMEDVLDKITGRSLEGRSQDVIRSFIGHLLPSRVDYVIYHPVDRINNLDACAPTMCTDYFTRLYRNVSSARTPTLKTSAQWITPPNATRGGVVSMGCTVRGDVWRVKEVQLRVNLLGSFQQAGVRTDGREIVAPVVTDDSSELSEGNVPPVGRTVFNGIYEQALGWYRFSDDCPEGNYVIDMDALLDDGSRVRLARLCASLDLSTERPTVAPMAIRRREPSIEQMMARYADVPVVEVGTRGVGYVIFDVRSFRNSGNVTLQQVQRRLEAESGTSVIPEYLKSR